MTFGVSSVHELKDTNRNNPRPPCCMELFSVPVLIRRRISPAHPTVNVPFSKLNSEHSAKFMPQNHNQRSAAAAVAIFPLLLRRFRGCKITDSRGYYLTIERIRASVQLSPRRDTDLLGFTPFIKSTVGKCSISITGKLFGICLKTM